MMDYVLDLLKIVLRVCATMIGAGIALLIMSALHGAAHGTPPSLGFYIGVAGLSIFLIVSDALEITARKK